MAERRRRPRWLARVERVTGRAGVLVVVLAILLWGAAHEATLLALALTSAVAALALGVARRLSGRTVPVGWPALVLLALAGFSALQLVPLPPALLSLLSPAAHELYLSAHAPLGLFPAWRPISLDPPATLFEVARLAGLACLFLVLDHRARSSDKGRDELLLWSALTLGALAVVALVLKISGHTSLFGLWSVDGISQHFVSPFRNDNHFAGALNVAAFVLLGFAAGTSADERWRGRWFTLAALACVATVLVGTSVGGLAATAVGLLVFAALTARGRQSGLPLVAVVVAGAVVLSVALPGAGVWTRHNEAAQQGKLVPVAAAWEIAGDYPVFGAGRGAFRTLHDRYLNNPSGVTYTHVENEPLQAIAEFGWPVGLTAVLLVLLAVAALVRRGASSLTEAGAAAAACALVVQSLADFSLHYAGAFLLVALLSTGDQGIEAPRVVRATSRVKPALVAGTLGIFTALLAWAFSFPSLPAEEARFEQLARNPASTTQEVDAAARRLLQRRPANYVAAQAVVTRALADDGSLGAQAPWLGTLLELAPENGHAHLLAGEALARLGAKSQALLEWRQAARLNVSSIAHVLRWYPELDAVRAAAPSEPKQVVELAKRLVAAGHADWALDVARSARQSPQPDLDLLLTDLYARAGLLEAALESAQALRKHSMHWNLAWRAEALALSHLGRVDESRRLLEEGLQRLPGDYMLGVLLSGQHQSEGRLQEALSVLALIDARERAAVRADVARLRSIVYERMGKISLALGEMRTAVHLAPTDQRARIRLARLCLASGLFDEAARALTLVDPTPEVAKLSEELARRRQPEAPSAADLEALLAAPASP